MSESLPPAKRPARRKPAADPSVEAAANPVPVPAPAAPRVRRAPVAAAAEGGPTAGTDAAVARTPRAAVAGAAATPKPRVPGAANPATRPAPPRPPATRPAAPRPPVPRTAATRPAAAGKSQPDPAPPAAVAAAATPGELPSFLRPKPSRFAPATGHAARAATPRPADASPRSVQALEWLLQRVPPRYRGRSREYLVLMRLDRPVGALLLLWPTWWALWLAANDFPSPGLLVVFTLGVFVMRSAGCVINDYADHGWLDARVERTRGRPMAAGRVSKREALTLFAGLLAFAFVLVLFTNAFTVKLAFVGAALAFVYPFTKRVTHLAQVVLGAAFGWSIPMAFAASTGSVPALAWLLFLANVLFSTIYDTQYAMVDRDEDIAVGAKSTAILFGDADRPILGVLMVTFLFAMLLVGTRAQLPWPYFVALGVATGLFGWQQWLLRDRSREHCFAAFRNNNWVGFVFWIGLLLALAIR